MPVIVECVRNGEERVKECKRVREEGQPLSLPKYPRDRPRVGCVDCLPWQCCLHSVGAVRTCWCDVCWTLVPEGCAPRRESVREERRQSG